MIVFRTDANSEIGMGHLMRCLSIADAFVGKKKNILFVISDKRSCQIIKGRGYDVSVLDSDYTDMETEVFLWPKEVLLCSKMIIVDSYFVSKEYFNRLREKMCVECVMAYIDDLFESPYDVDAIVNYNIYSDVEKYNRLYKGFDERIIPHFFCGVKYAPLRSMFYRNSKKTQHKIVRNVLISTGGADPDHLMLEIVKRLKNNDMGQNTDNIQFHCLVGNMNMDLEQLKVLVQEIPNVILHKSVNNMKALLVEMDLAVSAAGSTMYEICACGVPMITYITADNQINGAEGFERYGLAYCAGDIRDYTSLQKGVDVIIKKMKCLISNYEDRIKMGSRMQELVDGKGAKRLAGELLNAFDI